MDCVFGEFPEGGVEKKDVFRWVIEVDASGVLLGLTEGEASLLDFSASALIRCEMPEETLIFLATTTVSELACGSQGPDALRGMGCSGEKRPPLYG